MQGKNDEGHTSIGGVHNELKIRKNGEKLKEQPMSFMTLVVLTGLIGGLLLSSLAFLAYIFNFTSISPRIILDPWALGDWKKTWLGIVISIIIYWSYFDCCGTYLLCVFKKIQKYVGWNMLMDLFFFYLYFLS